MVVELANAQLVRRREIGRAAGADAREEVADGSVETGSVVLLGREEMRQHVTNRPAGAA